MNKNEKIIENYFNCINCKNKNLRSENGKLINYSTIILYWDIKLNQYILDYNYYSHSTRVIQNKILDISKKLNISLITKCLSSNKKIF